MSAFLSDAEVDDMTQGLCQNGARVRYLEGLGLFVRRKPNGRPLVLRSQAEAVLAGAAAVDALQARQTANPAHQPDRAGLIEFLAEKQRRR